MNVVIETTSELGRKLTISVPAGEVNVEIEKRLRELAKKVRLDGFRPGRVPIWVVRRRYGKQIEEEVTFELIDKTLKEVLKEQELAIAGQPKISDYKLSEEGLTYTVELEVLPEIDLKCLAELEIEKPVSEITDEDVERVVQRLREQRKRWHEVERPAQEGDRLTVDYEAFLDGDPIGRKVEDFQFLLGEKGMIPGFEKPFLGQKAGERFSFKITYPEDYADEKLAGEEVEFRVQLKKVEEGELPEVNEAFIKEFGVEEGSLEAFYGEVRSNLERQMKAALLERLKRNVLEAMAAARPIPIPEGLVQQQLQRHLAPYAELLKKNPEAVKRLPLENMREQAKKEVLYSLLLSKVIEEEKLEPDPERVRARAEEMASSYENPQEVVHHLLSNEQQRAELTRQILEEMALERILEQAKVKERRLSFQELMAA